MTPRQPHALRFPHEEPAPWAALLRLNDVVRCMDGIRQADLDAIVARNADRPDGIWELLHSARALLQAEGLR